MEKIPPNDEFDRLHLIKMLSQEWAQSEEVKADENI